MSKQVFVIFYRRVGNPDSEWHKLPHFFSSKEKAEDWLGPDLKFKESAMSYRDDWDSGEEFHIQGYDLDPEPIEYH